MNVPRRSSFRRPSFLRNAPGELKKDGYDYWYDMIAISDNSFIVAVADNYKYISGLFEKARREATQEDQRARREYPGYVSDIETISRTLAAS